MRFKNSCFIKHFFDINILRICLYLASIKEIQVNLKQKRNTYILYTYIAIFTQKIKISSSTHVHFLKNKSLLHEDGHDQCMHSQDLLTRCLRKGRRGWCRQIYLWEDASDPQVTLAGVSLAHFPFILRIFYSEKNDPHSMKFI